jgi:hypothetical protein
VKTIDPAWSHSNHAGSIVFTLRTLPPWRQKSPHDTQHS